jgi:hypothetical protein
MRTRHPQAIERAPDRVSNFRRAESAGHEIRNLGENLGRKYLTDDPLTKFVAQANSNEQGLRVLLPLRGSWL